MSLSGCRSGLGRDPRKRPSLRRETLASATRLGEKSLPGTGGILSPVARWLLSPKWARRTLQLGSGCGSCLGHELIAHGTAVCTGHAVSEAAIFVPKVQPRSGRQTRLGLG